MLKSFFIFLSSHSSLSARFFKCRNTALRHGGYVLAVCASLLALPFTNKYDWRTWARMALSSKSKKTGEPTAVWLPHLEVVLTTRCSLKCRYCANLMQYYAHPYDVPMDTFQASFRRLMSLVDYLGCVRPIGGEPFLAKNLPDALEFIMQYKQVQEIDIPTNGTAPIRDERLLKLLQDKRIRLTVTDYGYGDVEKFCAKLEQYHIQFFCRKTDKTSEIWFDYGDLNCRNRTPKELCAQFQNCKIPCRSLLNGKLFVCPRAGHGADLGVIPAKKGDYLDFLNDSHPVTRKELISYYYRNAPITACNYCDMGTSACQRTVPAGKEQLSKPLAVKR